MSEPNLGFSGPQWRRSACRCGPLKPVVRPLPSAHSDTTRNQNQTVMTSSMNTTYKYRRLSKDDAAVLLVDHQSGLITLVQDFSPNEFKNNVLALADVAKYFKLPTVLTTSFEDGPNGPIVPELREIHPEAAYIPRPGQINAWDNEDFVKAVKATGKKQLIIAGVLTEVCVAFPTFSALEDGHEVFVVTDASGTFNDVTRHSAWTRMAAAGAQLW